MAYLPPFHEKMNKGVKATATCLLEGDELKGRQREREREGGSVFFRYSLALKMHTPKRNLNV